MYIADIEQEKIIKYAESLGGKVVDTHYSDKRFAIELFNFIWEISVTYKKIIQIKVPKYPRRIIKAYHFNSMEEVFTGFQEAIEPYKEVNHSDFWDGSEMSFM